MKFEAKQAESKFFREVRYVAYLADAARVSDTVLEWKRDALDRENKRVRIIVDTIPALGPGGNEAALADGENVD